VNLRLTSSVVALLVAGAGTAGLASGRSWPDVQRPVLLVSGRDDHGLVELASVPLLDRPEGRPVGVVQDGGLVRVLQVQGTWHRVADLRSPSKGWVEDYRLRGTVHLVGGGSDCRPRLGGVLLTAGEQAELLDAGPDGVLVRLVRAPDVGGVVPVAALQQSPPGGPGACRGVPRYATDGHVHAHAHATGSRTGRSAAPRAARSRRNPQQ
jgi:hypothetical protein